MKEFFVFPQNYTLKELNMMKTSNIMKNHSIVAKKTTKIMHYDQLGNIHSYLRKQLKMHGNGTFPAIYSETSENLRKSVQKRCK